MIFVVLKFLHPLLSFFLNALLYVVHLVYFALINVNNLPHLADLVVLLRFQISKLFFHHGDLVVLQLHVGGFLGVLLCEEEVMIFEFFGHEADVPLDVIDFDGFFGLLFVEGLEQFSEQLSDFGFDLEPLELFDGYFGVGVGFLFPLFRFCHLINFIIIHFYHPNKRQIHQFYAFLITDCVSGDSSPVIYSNDIFFFLNNNSIPLNNPNIINKISPTTNTLP